MRFAIALVLFATGCAPTIMQVGIAPEDRGRIFGRFVRGANAAGTEGQGLGLSLVSRIVEAHGGTIGIESELGAGTTVRIALPLAGEAAEAEERG